MMEFLYFCIQIFCVLFLFLICWHMVVDIFFKRKTQFYLEVAHGLKKQKEGKEGSGEES